jgi:hypothetical protein
MATRLLIFLALLLASGASEACSIIIQIRLQFNQDSADLDQMQIIRLRNWLDEVRHWYDYADGEIEGAADPDETDANFLAKRRADATVKALESFYPELRVQSSAYTYPALLGSSDGLYSVVQLYPKKLPTDCNASVKSKETAAR